MTGKTHVSVGCLTSLALTATFGLVVPVGHAQVLMPLTIATSVFGSLLPDIDHGGSTFGKRCKLISANIEHRGITHTLLFPAILIFLCYYCSIMDNPVIATIGLNLIAGVTIGYVMHLIADLLTAKGIPLLWPVSRNKIHLFFLTTGNAGETIFLFGYAMAMGVVCYTQLSKFF